MWRKWKGTSARNANIIKGSLLKMNTVCFWIGTGFSTMNVIFLTVRSLVRVFKRRSATRGLLKFGNRGLKPTATVGASRCEAKQGIRNRKEPPVRGKAELDRARSSRCDGKVSRIRVL